VTESPKLGWPTWMGVVVDDMEAMTTFYRDRLGFRQTEKGDGWVQFDIDGHLFEVVERSSLPQYNGRRYQVGYTVGDIERERASLIAAGVEQITDIEGDDDTDNLWCYFRDPEGNVFEITEWKR
jgi:catechol 2,3-dioxygenase-like lactoylglutathione lyase family enzyme